MGVGASPADGEQAAVEGRHDGRKEEADDVCGEGVAHSGRPASVASNRRAGTGPLRPAMPRAPAPEGTILEAARWTGSVNTFSQSIFPS